MAEPRTTTSRHLAGSDILTNPPETTQAIHDSGKAYAAVSRVLPDQDDPRATSTPRWTCRTMEAGAYGARALAKFAEPHKQLIATIRRQAGKALDRRRADRRLTDPGRRLGLPALVSGPRALGLTRVAASRHTAVPVARPPDRPVVRREPR